MLSRNCSPACSPARTRHGMRTAWLLMVLPHAPGVDHLGELEHPVGQRGLAVVDVSDDAEVADAVRVRRTGCDGRGTGGAGIGPRWHSRPFVCVVAVLHGPMPAAPSPVRASRAPCDTALRSFA